MPLIQELPDDFDTSLDLNKVPPPGVASAGAATTTGTTTTRTTTTGSTTTGTTPNSKSAGIPSSLIDQTIPFPNSKLQPPATAPDGAASAPMPPAMANTRAHTAEELLTLLNRTPLFMTTLDESDGQGGSNADLDALRALAYEGTRAQVADGFRERGNECVAERDWKNARDFYTRALDYLAGVGEEGRKAAAAESSSKSWSTSAAPGSLEEKVQGKQSWSRRTESGALDGGEGEAEVDWADTGDTPADWTAEKETELARATQEKCAANRARCNLELQNYRAVTLDCALALRVNPRNVKAYFRSATALMHLDKLDEATDAINYCLSLDPDNKPAEVLADKIRARQEVVAEKERKRRQLAEQKQRELVSLQVALKARGYAVRMTKDRPTDVEDAEICLSDPLDAASELQLPVLFLYPTAGQTDLVKSVGEHSKLVQHLEYLLPPPWDANGLFGGPQDVNLFADTLAGGLAKVGRRLPVRDVLAGGKVVVADGLWRVYVVPRGQVSGWLDEMRRRRGSKS